MNARSRRPSRGTLALATLIVAFCGPALSASGAAESQPASTIRSILVLPPLNESADVDATASFLSTVSRPLAERGYYVFPVAVVDRLLKDNGMPTAGEMHQVPLAKVLEVTGADAVLYPVIHEYGTRYMVVASPFTVDVSARLVDTRTGAVLWEGRGQAQQSSTPGSDPITGAIAEWLVNNMMGRLGPGRPTTALANQALVTGRGGLFAAKSTPLAPGPRQPRQR